MQTVNSTGKLVGRLPQRELTIRDIRWVVYVPIGICLLLVVWLYAPTFSGWYKAWMAEESYYSHGILVPLISLLVVWLKRGRLKKISIQTCSLGYLLVVPSLLVVILMSWAGASNVQGFTFPALIGGLILVVLGRSMARELAFPIGYLYFMCVLPGFILTLISFRIQMLSTMGGTMMLRALTLDAYREGARITLPSVEVMVGAPCSGFRLLISLFAFAVLFAYLKEGPWWGRALLVAVTLPLSLVVNSIRITLIAVVGEFMGSEAMHSFHDYSGYMVLVLAFIALSLFARLVKCRKFNSMLIP